MKFKYFDDFERLSSLTETAEECEICERETICFDAAYIGEEDIEYVCPQCIFGGKLYGREIYTNQGDFETLLSQIKDRNKTLSEEQQVALAKERTRELEQATPPIITWQDMEWPCLDGDYAKFIGYGSKPFFNSLAEDGDGEYLFRESLHPDLEEYAEDDQWEEMVPGKAIKNYAASAKQSTLFYVFKSLISEKFIVCWDTD